MPNTKSAERRARSSVRRHLHNRMIKSRVNTLEKRYVQLVGDRKKDDAATMFRDVSSALDKAAKTGVIPRARANRKKSRLAARLVALK